MSVNLAEDSISAFQDLVKNIEGQVVVDFWATWCPPCRALSPVLDSLEKDGKVTVVKVDVDANPNLAMKFAVSSIPTMDFYSNGSENRNRLIGAHPRQAILNHIK